MNSVKLRFFVALGALCWAMSGLMSGLMSAQASDSICMNLSGKYRGLMRYEHVGAEEPISYRYEVTQEGCSRVNLKITYYAAAPGYTETFTETYEIGQSSSGQRVQWAPDGLSISQIVPNAGAAGKWVMSATHLGLSAQGDLRRTDVTTTVNPTADEHPSTVTIVGRYIGTRLK